MRPLLIYKLLSLGRYHRLCRDFRSPLRAHYAASGMSGRVQTLITRSGGNMAVDRGDAPIWEHYFSATECRVEIEGEFFRVTPANGAHPSYLIKGASGCFTYHPQRWHKRANRNPLLERLEAAERSVYSQHGEDGVIESLLQLLPVSDRYVVEFGAYDGLCMSNSRHLLADKGWSGFLIEADPRFYADLSRLYAGNARIKLHNGFVTEENINELFRQAGVPADFDLLSIDIDSIDYYVWRALTEFTPRIVIVEYNSSIPPDREYVVAREDALRLGGTAREGASLLSWYKLGLEKGYRLVYGELTGANLFFVHAACLSNIDVADIEPGDVYQPPQFGLLAGGVAPNGRGYPA